MSALITEEKLNLEEAIREVQDPQFGALAIFVGHVRGAENGRPIASIHYEAYKTMATKRMYRIIDTAFELWGARVVIHHRIGDVPVGEASVVIASTAKHRREAFGACQYTIDEIKTHVPIWKVSFQEAEICA